MDFVKMHGLGNDFVLLDCLGDGTSRTDAEWARLAAQVCDRHFGIGADGILVALPSETADVRMRIFNGDGSEAEMCGNGVRCLARYARDRGAATDHLRVETLAGVLSGQLESPVDVTLPGGTLRIEWQQGGSVFMTGPTAYVFRGTWLDE
jgi:diaminopimelate epimerase